MYAADLLPISLLPLAFAIFIQVLMRHCLLQPPVASILLSSCHILYAVTHYPTSPNRASDTEITHPPGDGASTLVSPLCSCQVQTHEQSRRCP